MKKFYLSLVALLVFTSLSQAQNIRLNLYGAYAFADRFDSYYDYNDYYDGKIEDGFQWGAGVEYMSRPNTGIELIYIRQDTDAPTYYLADGYFANERFTIFDLGINYIMLGANQYFKTSGAPIEGFIGVSGGTMIANIDNPDNGNSEGTTKFAWGAKIGGTYWLGPNLGIKAQALLLSAVQAMGGGFYFSGYGPSAGLSSYSTIYQFSLGGGLVFKIY